MKRKWQMHRSLVSMTIAFELFPVIYTNSIGKIEPKTFGSSTTLTGPSKVAILAPLLPNARVIMTLIFRVSTHKGILVHGHRPMLFELVSYFGFVEAPSIDHNYRNSMRSPKICEEREHKITFVLVWRLLCHMFKRHTLLLFLFRVFTEYLYNITYFSFR